MWIRTPDCWINLLCGAVGSMGRSLLCCVNGQSHRHCAKLCERNPSLSWVSLIMSSCHGFNPVTRLLCTRYSFCLYYLMVKLLRSRKSLTVSHDGPCIRATPSCQHLQRMMHNHLRRYWCRKCESCPGNLISWSHGLQMRSSAVRELCTQYDTVRCSELTEQCNPRLMRKRPFNKVMRTWEKAVRSCSNIGQSSVQFPCANTIPSPPDREHEASSIMTAKRGWQAQAW